MILLKLCCFVATLDVCLKKKVKNAEINVQRVEKLFIKN